MVCPNIRKCQFKYNVQFNVSEHALVDPQKDDHFQTCKDGPNGMLKGGL